MSNTLKSIVYLYACIYDFLFFLLPSTAGCTFETHSDIGPCEVTQGTEDDFDWYRVQEPHGNTDLPQGEHPSS